MASKSLKGKKKTFKRAFASFIFFFLGRAVVACSKLDSRVQQDFQEFPEGASIRLRVRPMGPSVVFVKEGQIIKLDKNFSGKPLLDIQFKNVEGALLALTAEKSVAQCFAENRMVINGDLAYGTVFVRIMNIVEAYLFPRIWTAYLFNNQAPYRERSQMRIYLATLFNK